MVVVVVTETDCSESCCCCGDGVGGGQQRVVLHGTEMRYGTQTRIQERDEIRKQVVCVSVCGCTGLHRINCMSNGFTT